MTGKKYRYRETAEKGRERKKVKRGKQVLKARGRKNRKGEEETEMALDFEIEGKRGRK